MSDSLTIRPHSAKQEQALFCQKRILLYAAGTQVGKTTVGGLRMKRKMHTFTHHEDNFLITAPTYKILQQSTLPAFLKHMDGFGQYSKADACFEMYRGGRCYMRTETDPDSIVGIPNIRHIWADESGKYRLYFWENIQARADSVGATIDLTTSPYALNWIYTELVKPAKAGKRPDVELIQQASWESPYHSLYDPEKLALKRATMDPRRFMMIYGGEFGRMVGLVYDCWDDDQNYVDPFELPSGTRYFGGIDWGYNPDPFALKIRALTPDGRQYGVSEFVKTRLTISDIIQVCRQKKDVFGIESFVADPSQPANIEEMNRAGLTCSGAINDIRPGIDAHYELIKSRRYKEFRGACPHSHDERESYHYPDPKDLKPDEDAKEQLPVDKNNHTQDADRYLTMKLRHVAEQRRPHTPGEQKNQETQAERLARLKRGSRNTQTESWS